MMKLALSAAMAMTVSASAPDFVTRPPAEFVGGPPIAMGLIVVPAHLIDAACRQIGGRASNMIVGCYVDGFVILPDPCVFRDEVFAQIACHEVAHARGWKHEVE
jgi:hypothetical protein